MLIDIVSNCKLYSLFLRNAYRFLFALFVVSSVGCDSQYADEQKYRILLEEPVCVPLCDSCIVLQCTTYFSQERVRRIYNHRSDTLVGEERVYYETGVLRTYSYYDVIGTLRYRRSYSAHGGILEERGDIVVQQIIEPPEAQVGDTITVHIYVVNPPGVIQQLVGLDNKLQKYPLFHEEEASGVFVQKFSLSNPGAFRIAYEALIKDTVNGTSQVENNSFVIRFR